MKKLFIMVLLGTQVSAFAVNRYLARDYTCNQLRTFIAEQGEVTISMGGIFGTRLYNNPYVCRRWDKEPAVRWYRTLTGRCQLYWACDWRRDRDDD